MMTIALLLGTAALGFGLATRLRVPAAPLVIALGIALRVAGAPVDESLLLDALALAATFLVFVVGTEFDLHHVGAQRWAALRLGATRLALLAALGLSVAMLLELAWAPTIYFTLALTASSTLLVTGTLRQREEYFEPLGRTLVGVLMLQSLVVIVLASAVDVVTRGAAATLLGAAGVLALLALTWLCNRFFGPRVLVRPALDEEHQLVLVLAMVFVFMGVAYGAGLPAVLGAFFAGVSLSRFPVSGIVRGHVASFSDFFVAVFYVGLGATVVLPGVRELLVEGILVAAVALLVPPLLIELARRAGLTLRSSIEGANLLAQCGELCLVVGLLGLQRGHLSEGAFGVIVMVTVVTMSMMPVVASERVTQLLLRWYPSARQEDAAAPRDHVLIIGCGSSTGELIDRLHEQGRDVVAVDDDPVVFEALTARGIRALRGDGGDSELLRAAGAATARIVISTMRRSRDNDRLLAIARGVPVLVRVFSAAEAERVRALGGQPITEAELGSAAFLAWYERQLSVAGRPARS